MKYNEVTIGPDGVTGTSTDMQELIARLRAENEALRTWISNVATDEQLDAPVPALQGQSGRELLAAGRE